MGRPRKGEPGAAEATAKFKKSIIEKYGGPEGYHKHMQEIGRKGGRAKVEKGFALNHERARLAGAKGGRISRRYGSVLTAKMNAEKQKIIEMLNNGCPKKEIADWLDVGYVTFRNWAIKNISMEVLYKDELDEEKDS